MHSTSARAPRRLRTRIAINLAASAAALVAIVPVASAGKAPTGGGGKPSGGTSSMTMVVIDSADGLPHYNGKIRFEVSTSATSRPSVDVNCVQNGTTVYIAQTGYYADYPWPWTQTFTLASGAWTGGAADCVARLYWASGKQTVVGKTMSFHVYE